MEPDPKTFAIGIHMEKTRAIGWEMGCGVVFYVLVFVNIILAIAINASKNTDMAIYENGHATCPGTMVMASECGHQIVGFHRCVSESICDDIRECLSRRLLVQQGYNVSNAKMEMLQAPLSQREQLQRLASEKGPATPQRIFERLRAKRRLIDEADVPDGIFEFLEEHWYQPTVLCISSFVLGGLWLILLGMFTAVVVWFTLSMDVLLPTIVIIWHGVAYGYVNWPLLLLVIFLIGAMITFREGIKNNCKIMHTAMCGLNANKCAFAMSVSTVLLWGLYFALWVSSIVGSHFVVEVVPDRYHSGWCELTTQGWADNAWMKIYWVVLYFWVVAFFKNTSLIMLTVSLSGWYFNEDGHSQFWIKGLGWALGRLSGANALCSFIMGATQYLMSLLHSRTAICCAVLNPFNWIFMCVACCLQTIVQTYTKFALISCTYCGMTFCESAEEGIRILKDRLGDAILVDYLGSRVMSLATYILSLAVCFMALYWADSVQGVDYMLQEIAEESVLLLFFVILVYIYLMRRPFMVIILVILFGTWIDGQVCTGNNIDSTCLEIRARLNSVLASLFFGAMISYVLSFASVVVVNAMDITLFCYAVEEKHQQSQERFEAFYSSVKALFVAGTTPQSTNIAMGCPPGETLVAVTVPEGVQSGQELQVQTPGGLVSCQVPVGVGPGQTFQVMVKNATPEAASITTVEPVTVRMQSAQVPEITGVPLPGQNENNQVNNQVV